MRLCAQIAPHASYPHDERPKPQSLHYLKSLLLSNLNSSAKSLIYTEIVSHLGQQNTLNEEEALLFAQAVFFVKATGLNPDLISPLCMFEFEKAKLTHGRCILNMVTNNPAMIHAIIRQDEEAEPILDWVKGADGTFSSDRLQATFNPLEGRLKLAKLASQPIPIPFTILMDSSFQKLFPEVNTAIYNDPYYEFEIPGKGQFRVSSKSKQIEKFFPEHGLCKLYVETREKERGLPSDLIQFNGTHWINLCYSLSSPTIVTEDPHTHTIKYLSKNGKLIDTQTGLQLSTPHPLYQTLEDAAFIHQWLLSLF